MVMNYSIYKVFGPLYLKGSKATDGFCILRFLAFQRQLKKTKLKTSCLSRIWISLIWRKMLFFIILTGIMYAFI